MEHKKWEYKIHPKPKTYSPDSLETLFNEMGKDGWELATSFLAVQKESRNEGNLFIFKRPVLNKPS